MEQGTGIDIIKELLGQALASGAHSRRIEFVRFPFIALPNKNSTLKGAVFIWSRVRESNPPSRLGKPLYYRYTNPASTCIIANSIVKINHFLSVGWQFARRCATMEKRRDRNGIRTGAGN